MESYSCLSLSINSESLDVAPAITDMNNKKIMKCDFIQILFSLLIYAKKYKKEHALFLNSKNNEDLVLSYLKLSLKKKRLPTKSDNLIKKCLS